ncbi:MAG: hypothetical protein PF501_02625 [Salinisphaera sp.]|nr:hypothetical protein [Salinisphaera sp.]
MNNKQSDDSGAAVGPTVCALESRASSDPREYAASGCINSGTLAYHQAMTDVLPDDLNTLPRQRTGAD